MNIIYYRWKSNGNKYNYVKWSRDRAEASEQIEQEIEQKKE